MKKFLIPILLGLVSFFLANACKEKTELEEPRTVTVSASFSQEWTRGEIEQEEGSLNLIARWSEDDKIALFLFQDGKGFTLDPAKVYNISSDGKRCSFGFQLPSDISIDHPYDIYGLCDVEGALWEEEGFVFAKSQLKRMAWGNRNMVPVWFHAEGGQSVIQANFLHLGTYEILHVTNTSKAGVTFRHDGFDVEEPWYKSSENTPLKEDYDPTHNVEEPGDDASSGSVFIPAGSTEKFLSWYVPRGGTIIDATLLATINGNSVRSSNTKNSSVRIQRGHVYHMYATWDGNELKFGNANELPDELGIGFTHLDMQEDGAYGFTTGREGHLSFESTDPSVATAIETDDIGELHVDICAHTIGTAIISITDTDTGQKSQIEVVVRERTDFGATVRLGETYSVKMKNTDGHYEAYSDNTSIATCEVSGSIIYVSGKKTGETTIHVTELGTGKQFLINVLVYYDGALQNVPEAVDLGLPSGLKWASFNLGASKPEEPGDYYAFGETESKEEYAWETYKWCNGTYYSLTKYCFNSNYGFNGFVDNKCILDPDDDVASIKLGGNWRMPTKAEQDELRSRCNWKWTSINGVDGWQVTGPNNNSIFLPLNGFWQESGFNSEIKGVYWSSSLDSSFSGTACAQIFWTGPNVTVSWGSYPFCDGLSVRPVYADSNSPEIEVTPTDIKFGAVPYGSSSTKYVTVKNIGTGVLTFSVTNVSSPYSVETNADGSPKDYSLSAGESMQLAFTFTPNSATYMGGGRCTIVSNATESPISVTYSGQGAEPRQVAVPEAVDLGLSVQWASFNLGAARPEEYGDYYAWGETEPYYSSLEPLMWKPGKEAGYDWPSYNWCMGADDTMTKYCTDSSYGYNGLVDGKTCLDPEDDAAYMHLGGYWRMPTEDEIEELYDILRCSWELTSLNGVKGYKVTGHYGGNSIFLPCAGRWNGDELDGVESSGEYWTSSLYEEKPRAAYYWQGYSGQGFAFNGAAIRSVGLPIRPVYDDPDYNPGYVPGDPPEGGLD